MYKVAIVTISDKGSRGEREDITGKELKKMVDAHKDYETVLETIIPDEEFIIVNKLKEIADMEDVDLILTNGGTGFSERDVKIILLLTDSHTFSISSIFLSFRIDTTIVISSGL